MKIQKIKKSRTHRPFIWIIVSIFLLLCVYCGSAYKAHLWPFDGTSTTPTMTSDKIDSTTTPSPKATNSTSSNSVDSQKTTNQVPLDNSLAATITQITEDDSGNILFAATVNGVNTGTCVITFSNSNDKPHVTQVEATSKDASSAICGPLSISSQDFSYLGQWNVNLRFYTDNQQVTTNGIINIH